MELNEALSVAIGKRIRARRSHCYHNAFRALDHLPSAVYVEGIAVRSSTGDNPPMPIEHGWLEHEGAIVDPSLRLLGGADRMVGYCPGLRFTGAELFEALRTVPKGKESDDLPIFYRFGWGGGDSAGMVAAWIAAYELMGVEVPPMWRESLAKLRARGA